MAEKEREEKKKKPKAKAKKKEKKPEEKPRKIADIRPGYLVRVVHLSPDGKRDFTTEGVVLRVRGEGDNRTFTVRRIAKGVGVEKVFSFINPALKELTVIKENKARRARLYFLRSDQLRGAKKSQYFKG